MLIADQDVSVGWECSHVLVIDLGGGCDLVNLVMRRVGYCPLVKEAPKRPTYDLEDSKLEGDMLKIAIALSLEEQ